MCRTMATPSRHVAVILMAALVLLACNPVAAARRLPDPACIAKIKTSLLSKCKPDLDDYDPINNCAEGCRSIIAPEATKFAGDCVTECASYCPIKGIGQPCNSCQARAMRLAHFFCSWYE